MSKPRLVIVTWNDACSTATKIFAPADHCPVIMYTVGWLMAKDASGVSVCCERFEEDGTWHYRGHTFLPAGMKPTIKTL